MSVEVVFDRVGLDFIVGGQGVEGGKRFGVVAKMVVDGVLTTKRWKCLEVFEKWYVLSRISLCVLSYHQGDLEVVQVRELHHKDDWRP